MPRICKVFSLRWERPRYADPNRRPSPDRHSAPAAAGFALLQGELRLPAFADVDDRAWKPQRRSLRVIEALAARNDPADAPSLWTRRQSSESFSPVAIACSIAAFRRPTSSGCTAFEVLQQGSACLAHVRIDRAQRGELCVAIGGVRWNMPIPGSDHPCGIQRRAEPILAFTQRLFRQMTLDRQRNRVRNERNRVQVALGGARGSR